MSVSKSTKRRVVLLKKKTNNFMDKLTNKQISQHRSLPQNVLIVKVLKKIPLEHSLNLQGRNWE
jgi:hypothetical protein